MGCVNSTTAAYPGNRRVAQPAYQPSDSDYHQVDSNTAVANAHFVTCQGGGNALKLEGKPHRSDGNNNNTQQSNNGGQPPTYISVTLPIGVTSGDIIHVRAPDGRLNAITVPPGMGPGSTFTVEFSNDTPAPPKEEELTPGVYVPTVMAVAEEEEYQPLIMTNNYPVVATAVPHVDNAFATSNGKY